MNLSTENLVSKLEFKESWMNQVCEIAENAANTHNCFLYDIEFVGSGGGRVLRVYLDKESGVTLDDCSNVSKMLNEALDTQDIVPGEMYNLEVSSPGLERILRLPWHFEKVVGKKIWVQISQGLGSLGVQHKAYTLTKKFESRLLGISDDQLLFKFDDEDFKLKMDLIEKAHVVFEMEEDSEKSEQKNKKIKK